VLLSGPAIATAAAPAAQVRTQADGKHEDRGRGTLVSAEKLYTLATPQAVAAELGGAGFEGDTVRHGLVAYRLVYRTVDPQGGPTTASGLLVLPLNSERRLQAVSFAHGTGHALERKVMLTGFSQGASAALGLGRALQASEDHWFRMGALAPISGAYDFGGTELPAFLEGRLDPKSSVLYAACTLVVFNRLHHVYDSPGGVFRAPYDRTVEALFDGAHTGEQLMRGTPGTLARLLTGHGRELLAHPPGPLAAALRTTDAVCTDWAPRAPARLSMATGDEQAVTANTEYCRDALLRNGVDAPVVDLGAVDHHGSRHLGSNVAATPAIVRWFGELRQR
jgi:hypothetical protein